MITVSRSSRANNAIILRTDGEGDTLPIDVVYFCSAGEDCDMFEPDYSVNFTLPIGWGAQKAQRSRNGEIAFDMATMTPDGAFYATLNDPNRSANVGPCYDVIAGALCHAATKDPKLIADIDIIRRGLSVQAIGEPLDQKAIDALLNKLTGTSK
jgi:Ca-activated chloride channel family protein